MALEVVVSAPQGHPSPVWNRLDKNLLSRIKSSIPLPRRSNTTYSPSEVALPILRAGVSGLYPTQAARLLRSCGEHTPSPDDLVHRLNQMDGEEVRAWFTKMNRSLVEANGGLGPSIIALDIHKRPFYGKDRRHAVGSKRHRGTNYAHAIVSIDRVAKPRLTLWAEPFMPMERLADKVEEGISLVRTMQEIELVLIDREAYTADCVRVLDSLKVNYVIPVPKSAGIKKRIAEARNRAKMKFSSERGAFWVPHRVKGVPTFLVIVFDTTSADGCFAFVTNNEPTEEAARKLARVYRQRWGIETGYRVRRLWKITTNCLVFAVRLFFMLFEILLYNLWLLVNEAWTGQTKKDRYPISRWLFQKLVFPAG